MNGIGIILSGGVGNRMKSAVPKQYISVDGRMIIDYCLDRFVSHPRIDALIIAVADEWKQIVNKGIIDRRLKIPVYYSAPGEVRQETIYKALRVAAEHYSERDIVIIHDAARPMVSDRLIDDCMDACKMYDGAMPVLPVKDTIYQSKDGATISSLLPRSTLFAGQAPEAFVLGKYLNAHRTITRDELLTVNGSSELAHKQGLSIKLIAGDERNFKITTPEDLHRFEQLIK